MSNQTPQLPLEIISCIIEFAVSSAGGTPDEEYDSTVSALSDSPSLELQLSLVNSTFYECVRRFSPAFAHLRLPSSASDSLLLHVDPDRLHPEFIQKIQTVSLCIQQSPENIALALRSLSGTRVHTLTFFLGALDLSSWSQPGDEDRGIDLWNKMYELWGNLISAVKNLRERGGGGAAAAAFSSFDLPLIETLEFDFYTDRNEDIRNSRDLLVGDLFLTNGGTDVELLSSLLPSVSSIEIGAWEEVEPHVMILIPALVEELQGEEVSWKGLLNFKKLRTLVLNFHGQCAGETLFRSLGFLKGKDLKTVLYKPEVSYKGGNGTLSCPEGEEWQPGLYPDILHLYIEPTGRDWDVELSFTTTPFITFTVSEDGSPVPGYTSGKNNFSLEVYEHARLLIDTSVAIAPLSAPPPSPPPHQVQKLKDFYSWLRTQGWDGFAQINVLDTSTSPWIPSSEMEDGNAAVPTRNGRAWTSFIIHEKMKALKIHVPPEDIASLKDVKASKSYYKETFSRILAFPSIRALSLDYISALGPDLLTPISKHLVSLRLLCGGKPAAFSSTATTAIQFPNLIALSLIQWTPSATEFRELVVGMPALRQVHVVVTVVESLSEKESAVERDLRAFAARRKVEKMVWEEARRTEKVLEGLRVGVSFV